MRSYAVRVQVTIRVDETYYTLNLRAEPSAEAEAVAVLDRNGLARVEELTNDS